MIADDAKLLAMRREVRTERDGSDDADARYANSCLRY